MPAVRIAGTRTVVERGGEGYPEGLLDMARPPKRLYCVGDQSLLQLPSLSIVGARKSTPYGRSLARRFAAQAASYGVVVVSGGAHGCDSESHEGALEAAGKTVVVLGGGCDMPYPRANTGLFESVVAHGGLLVSEWDWDTHPQPFMFRLRNRLIAGLSRATLIVEAGMPSGTFSTADDALDANREVWAVPGAITSPTSRGANQLIAQGAQPVVDDACFGSLLSATFGVLQCMRAGEGAAMAGDKDEDALLSALRAQALSVDELLQSGLAIPKGSNPLSWVMLRLSQLECKGVVERRADGRYCAVR